MADSKVSELVTATNVGSGDFMYLVQSNTSKKITTGTFFNKAANVTLGGVTKLDSNVQILASPGTIDLSKPITHLSTGASSGTVTLPTGDANQIKIIVMTGSTGGIYTISSSGSNVAGGNVVFNARGDTATMLYTNNKWYVIGGTATIT